jgi:hypothetical protein
MGANLAQTIASTCSTIANLDSVPSLGIHSNTVFSTQNNSEIFNDTSIQSSELNLRLRTGIKVSFCSFIFATDYQFGNGGFLNGKLSYVLFVGNKCSKKYIRECNPVDWSQF